MPPRNQFNIKEHIVDDYFFERMQYQCYKCDGLDESNNENDEKECYCGVTYEEFIEWNVEAFDQLSTERKSWIQILCKECRSSKIDIMDEETCVAFTAQEIFFDRKGRLVITNPR